MPSGLPEIVAGSYIALAMLKVGPVRDTGFGIVPTDWDIIHPFVQATGCLSEPWEIETLAAMCRAYASGLSDKDVLSIPPCEREQPSE